MMKHMKKMVSLLLAMVMAFAMTITTFAANVEVPDKLSGHTFKAYQIFTGTQAESEGALGDVEWGNGIDSAKFLAALKADATVGAIFEDCTTAADVAEALGKIKDNSDAAKAVAKLAYANKTGNGEELVSGENELADGYYLIVDESGNLNEGDYALNAALLQVTDTITIDVKTDKPTVEKKVQEDDKYNQDGGYGNGYNDVADYNMGDAVPFKLIGSVPDMTYYDTYKYIFHDTLSAGLTAPEVSNIKVYVADDKAGKGKVDITEEFGITVHEQTITVSSDDIKTIEGVTKGKYIIVEYTAVLNQSAEVGLPGNENEVYLEYSNNPDQSGEGENHPTGETPKDKVIVFTYELDTTKVDGEDKKPLKDAEFKLHDEDGKWVIVDEKGKVTGWTENENDGSTLKSDANGLFKVIGLDDGTYYLKETKAPAGYNILKDEIEVVITATTSNVQNWDGTPGNALTELDVTADGEAGTGNAESGIAGITVANNKGATLPETGGMGTTMFYVIGAGLMIVAAVLLITKKKMSGQND